LDYQLEQWITGPAGHHAFLDTLMKDAANWAVPVVIGVVAAWFVIGWVLGRQEARRGAVLALFAADGALLVNQVLIRIWDRPRPSIAHPHAVHVLVSPSTESSFPSNDAAAAIAIAVAVFLLHRRIGLVVLALMLLVCYARVHVGARYPGDVLAGALIGLAVTLLLWRSLAIVPTKVNDALTWLVRRLHLPLPLADRERRAVHSGRYAPPRDRPARDGNFVSVRAGFFGVAQIGPPALEDALHVRPPLSTNPSMAVPGVWENDASAPNPIAMLSRLCIT
jgi:undecaprenyl-diphosphatase